MMAQFERIEPGNGNYLVPLDLNIEQSKPKPVLHIHQVGKGKRVLKKGGKETFICPVCSQKFARTWTLNRHMNDKHPKTSDLESEKEDNSVVNDIEDVTSYKPKPDKHRKNDNDLEESLSKNSIDNVRHLLAIAEIGKIKVTRAALLSLIPGIPCNYHKRADHISNGDFPYEFRHQSLSALRELLLAVKFKQMILTKRLYIDIIDGLDLTDREPMESDEDSD